ncbi:uncharacterized protein LACBIDRAFT_316242 [Laccaria bicolor S238N-H82]|uniref:Predicted protein n=1 Tax=Laccaria bicolor (strain S238N-H82 / ATCC MYA-4686) TaxID=486041 RepID=B0E0I5_LACBS|nr:uncharacterized protein LACBIDRAFT_316242 [Laccaria bicolor S238N-H82]EDQ99626.1 predicted protein [Laccaria bicolor S238N-H82]|eukprot:XP_001889737.1 predicted protein [Laccaria bicolor S238N-H82]
MYTESRCRTFNSLSWPPYGPLDYCRQQYRFLYLFNATCHPTDSKSLQRHGSKRRLDAFIGVHLAPNALL